MIVYRKLVYAKTKLIKYILIYFAISGLSIEITKQSKDIK